jgi:hypothetical protein
MMFGKIIAIPVVIAAVAFVSFVPLIEAVPITGSIDIQGGGALLTPKGAPLGTATGVDATNGVVMSGSGSFAGTINAQVNFDPFTFNPATTPVTLWSFTSGSLTYSFDLTSMVLGIDNSSLLTISGIGTLTITGDGSDWDATQGSWSYQIATATSPYADDGVFNYDSNTTVPDGGLTVILLGSALSSLFLLRKQISA